MGVEEAPLPLSLRGPLHFQWGFSWLAACSPSLRTPLNWVDIWRDESQLSCRDQIPPASCSAWYYSSEESRTDIWIHFHELLFILLFCVHIQGDSLRNLWGRLSLLNDSGENWCLEEGEGNESLEISKIQPEMHVWKQPIYNSLP